MGLRTGRINTEVFTSPHPTPELDPLPRILAVIGQAKATIHLSAYSFTSKPIAQAVIAAAQGGVTVTAVLDATEYGGPTSQGPELAAVLNSAGRRWLRVWGSRWQLNHTKCIVVDADLPKTVAVINGSYNFTTQAETQNVECCEIKTGTQVTRVMAPTYRDQILADFSHARVPA